MYKSKKNPSQTTLDFSEFRLPFGGKLNRNNRWVQLSKIIPWDKFEENYSQHFSEGMGARAISFRVALGALIIKERLRITDREAVEQIIENPYLQYFLGFSEFQKQAPFDASMYVYFRKRISEKVISQINESIIESAIDNHKESDNQSDDDHNDGAGGKGGNSSNNNGKLIIDATCTPADVRYPTDISILNEAREKTENIIDVLWEAAKHTEGDFKKKPRTHRKRARRDFLRVIKNKKNKERINRKGIRKQLSYLNRNLEYIGKLSDVAPLSLLSKFSYRCLLVIHEVYRQQEQMYANRTHRIEDRIVSITGPHVRPIVRGKAGKKVEFGAKISASSFLGFSMVDKISWDAYNESEDLVSQVKSHKRRYGCYPSSVHADKIYLTRANRKWCKEHSIRLSGPPLGRPLKVTEKTRNQIKLQKKLARQDEIDRIDIEARFGHSKRRYGLDRVMAKLSNTSESVIALVFLVMNLEKVLRDLFLPWYLLGAACCSGVCTIIRNRLPNSAVKSLELILGRKEMWFVLAK